MQVGALPAYEHSLSRAYRWGEDGLLGITDRECRLCFALALWNGKDPHLKERLFGLTNPEGVPGQYPLRHLVQFDALARQPGRTGAPDPTLWRGRLSDR